MPTIFFYGPKLDKEKSREMISSFTDTASKLTGIDKSSFVQNLEHTFWFSQPTLLFFSLFIVDINIIQPSKFTNFGCIAMDVIITGTLVNHMY